jgi:Fe2+ or Zn2+ uptake regulation protein
MRPAEERYTALILNCAVYRSGDVFAIHDLQRALPGNTEYVSAARLREVMNALFDQGKVDRVAAPNGETHYRIRSGSQDLLRKLWARPVSDQYSPRWC